MKDLDPDYDTDHHRDMHALEKLTDTFAQKTNSTTKCNSLCPCVQQIPLKMTDGRYHVYHKARLICEEHNRRALKGKLFSRDKTSATTSKRRAIAVLSNIESACHMCELFKTIEYNDFNPVTEEEKTRHFSEASTLIIPHPDSGHLCVDISEANLRYRSTFTWFAADWDWLNISKDEKDYLEHLANEPVDDYFYPNFHSDKKRKKLVFSTSDASEATILVAIFNGGSGSSL
jgi:hypothetical protein